MTNSEQHPRSRFWFVAALGPRTSFSVIGALAAIIIGGLLLLVGTALAAPFLFLGVVLLAFAGYSFDRFSVSGLGFKMEATIREREHGKEFLVAAATAPDMALAAVIPLLRRDVASEVIKLPPAYDGLALTDADLTWIRQKFNATVFAVRRPGDEEWSGGGRISDLRLPEGSEIALLGERADLDQVAQRLASGYRGTP